MMKEKYIEVLDSYKESIYSYIRRKENEFKEYFREYLEIKNKSFEDYIDWFIKSENCIKDECVFRNYILYDLKQLGLMRIEDFIIKFNIKKSEMDYDIYTYENSNLDLQAVLLLCDAYSDIEDIGFVNYSTLCKMKFYKEEKTKIFEGTTNEKVY